MINYLDICKSVYHHYVKYTLSLNKNTKKNLIPINIIRDKLNS